MTDAESSLGDCEIPFPDPGELRALEEQISTHRAWRLNHRLSEVTRILESWLGFSLSLSILLERCEHEEAVVIELLRQYPDRSGRDAAVRSLDQHLIAYVAGLGALIDHTRALINHQPKAIGERYRERTESLLIEHPEAVFLRSLRNYVLHRVAAPWEFAGTFGEDQAPEAKVFLSSETLLEDKSSWNSAAKQFIQRGGDRIHLSAILPPYHAAMERHIKQTLAELWNDNAEVIEECNLLIKERNLLATGGVSDGTDWKQRIAHVAENLKRMKHGEAQLDYRTGLPIPEEPDARSR